MTDPAVPTPSLATVSRDALRVLTFRRPTRAIVESWRAYLAFGLFFTWLAGVGRYWDSPRATVWQHLGLGSVVYVFVLAFVLWAVVAPLAPARWSYRNVLVFVTLTSPPALLYAIPVERFMSMNAAQDMNVGFLAVVATWRVVLLMWFLRTVARLAIVELVVASVMPLALIVVVLAQLNLEHVVFNFMAGLAPEDRSANDRAYVLVVRIAFLSFGAAPYLLFAYALAVVNRRFF